MSSWLAGMLLCGLSATVGAATAIEGEIGRHAAALGLEVGVTALHLGSGEEVSVNGNTLFPLASTYKVPMAAYALHLVEQGELRLDRMVRVEQSDYVISSSITQLFPHPGVSLSVLNLMEATLIRSDNTATDMLLRTVGGGEAVTGWLREQGIDDLRVDRSTADLIRDYAGVEAPDDPGVSMAMQWADLTEAPTPEEMRTQYRRLLDDPRDQGTPRAMVRLLEGIWRDSYLAADASNTLRTIMHRCFTGSARLSAGLPDQQLPIAHKTGTIGGTVNDVGVMALPDGRGDVVIAVFTKGTSTLDVAAGEALIAEIGRSVYDYFLFSAANHPGKNQ